ncbi:MAG: zf-HC2 domain-containing protein [Planctomycetia bacterium]|jgi:hypothetical protein|nr:zf-HC2 domain-containing protein [Planctomycetia bacterium]MCC7314638.1 zf-HC2 domain-containing protein [Planctomycetota bacterium]OQZ01612.1 MAG: hypothetical protein B6D36_14035 [Planctomycetes bacterium UTPLA1]
MMGCEKTRIRLDDWLDGLLDESARGEVNDHLAFCDECRARFKRHVDLQGDLVELGVLADRIATGESRIASSRSWRVGRVAVTAAAAVMLVWAGTHFARSWRIAQEPGSVESPVLTVAASEQPLPLGDLMVSRIDATQISIKGGPECVAVNVQTSNPKIQIVWLYGECQSPATPVKDETDTKLNPARRL